jgi:hypothetical protein
MIFNDATHLQIKKRKKDNNAKNIDTPEVDDCLCVMHDV